MESESIVEKVARAFFSEVDLTRKPWESQTEAYRNDCRRMARAAISAMREPTEKMMRAGSNANCFESGDRDMGLHDREAEIVYTAMIDAALK